MLLKLKKKNKKNSSTVCRTKIKSNIRSRPLINKRCRSKYTLYWGLYFPEMRMSCLHPPNVVWTEGHACVDYAHVQPPK